jgi:uncharacterized protein YlxP (DUF503 family)
MRYNYLIPKNTITKHNNKGTGTEAEDRMIASAKLKLYMPWVHSLKEKRMVVKSICAKVRNRYNVSIAEVEEQDTHQTAVLGFAAVVGDRAQADSILDHVINYIENNSDGELVQVERDIL